MRLALPVVRIMLYNRPPCIFRSQLASSYEICYESITPVLNLASLFPVHIEAISKIEKWFEVKEGAGS
jgi:hypothetical protein